MLVMISFLITIIAAMSSMMGFMARNTKASRENTNQIVVAENIFTYVDIAIGKEIEKIYEETRIKTEGSMKKEEGGGGEKEKEKDLEKFILAFATEFGKLEKSINQKMKDLFMEVGSQIDYSGGEPSFTEARMTYYKYDNMKKYYTSTTNPKPERSSDKIAFEIRIRMRDKNQRLNYQKAYFINIDQMILNQEPFDLEEALIFGKTIHYKD